MAIVERETGMVLSTLPQTATDDEIFAEMRRLAEIYGEDLRMAVA